MTEFVPDHTNARAFRDALGNFATGVTVVTINTPDGPQGVTANSFASLSLAPPLVLWSPGKFSRRHDMFAQAPYFSVHVLAEDQKDLADRFTKGGAQFDGLAVDISPNCDCEPNNDAHIVPDLGMFASFDPVAIDQACADAVIKAPVLADTYLTENLGLGTRKYELVKI